MKVKEAIEQLRQIANEIEAHINPKLIPKDQHIYNEDTEVCLVFEPVDGPLQTCEIIRFKSAISPTGDKLTSTGRHTHNIFIEVREKKKGS